MAGNELATAYVSLVVETRGVRDAIDRTLRASGASADRAGRDMGSKMGASLAATMSKVVAAAAPAAAIGTVLTKGWQRLSAIDEAQGKLTALGHTTQSTAKIMDSALASVKGTSYGLGEAASISASAVAAGIKPGEELTRYLSLVADTATVAGAPLEEIGMLFNQATTKGKVYTLQLNQLAQRGIPIYQYLAKELGVTQEALSDMVSEGKVDAETYRRAIENNIGGAATAATTVGSQWANTMAATGRLGAAALEPTFKRIAGWLGTGISALDDMTDAVKPLAVALDNKVFNEWGPKLAEGLAKASESWSNSQGPSILADSAARLVGVLDDLRGVYDALWPSAEQIAKSLLEASSATGVSVWQVLLATLEAVAPILNATLVPALQATASLMENNQGAVTAMVLAYAAFKTVPALMTPIAAGLASMRAGALRAVDPVRSIATATGAVASAGRFGAVEMGRFGSAVSAVGAHAPGVLRMQNAFVTAAAGADRFGRMAGTAAAGMTGIRAAGGGAVRSVGALGDALGGPLALGLMAVVGGFVAVNGEIGKNRRHHEQLQENTAAAAIAQRDLARALGDTQGAITDDVLNVVASDVARIRTESAALAETGPGIAGQVAAGWQILGNAVLGTGRSYADAAQKQDQAARSAGRLEAGLDALKMSDQELAQVLTGSERNWMLFSASIDKTDASAVAAYNSLRGQRDVIMSTKEAAELASPAAGEMAAAIGTLADKSQSAADRGKALHRVLQILAGVKPDVEQAAADFGEMIDNLKSGSDWDPEGGLGEGLLKDGALDMSVANARLLREEMDGLIAHLSTLASSGAPLDDYLAESEEQIKRWAQNSGLEVAEVRELFESRGFDIDELILHVGVAGKDQVVQDLQSINNEFRTTEDQQIRVSITDDGTKEWLRDAGFILKEVEGTAFVDIQPKDPSAMVLLDGYLDKYRELDGLTSTPKLELDDEKFQLSAEDAQKLIGILGESTPTPAADLIIKSLEDNGEISMKMLQDLADANPETSFWLKIQEAMNNAQVVSKAIDDAAEDRTATINVRYLVQDSGARREYFGNPTTQGPIPLGLPGNSTGARLPTTGPGTDRTDGILAATRAGTPVAWVDGGEWIVNSHSSEKHNGLLAAINRDDPRLSMLPAFADGGIIDSMRRVVQAKFPGMELTSGLRFTDNGYHSKGMAADFSNTGAGMPSTPQMQALAAWIADNYAGITLQLIHSPFGRNIGQGQGFVGDGLGFYGSGTMSEHSDHVHWAVSEEVGEPTGPDGVGGTYSKPIEWTEKDELALESARVSVLQAQEARDKAYANEKKSDADRRQADLKVQRAELKVRELEAKRDGKGGAEQIVTPAPELEGEMDDDTLTIRRAEIAIMDAQLARDKVYSDPESTTLDKEKADIAVYDARNNLDSTIERIEKANEDTDSSSGQARTPRERIKQYFAEMAGIGFDALLEITGLGESRWWDLPVYELDSAKDDKNKSKSKSKKAKDTDIVGSKSGDAHDDGGRPNPLIDQMREALGVVPQDFAQPMSDPATPEWIEKHLKKLPLKVYDGGGWLNPNEMAINLGSTPEPIFNSPIQLSRFMSQNANMLEPAAAGAPADYSIKIINPQFANESRMLRAARGMQERQMMRNTGRPR